MSEHAESVEREVDRVMNERAATACRSLAESARKAGVNVDWFQWVPAHLDQIAAGSTSNQEPDA